MNKKYCWLIIVLIWFLTNCSTRKNTLANLRHPDAGTMPGNLMNQTLRDDAGTKITDDQMKKIVDDSKAGNINKGQQSAP
jgi:hypothetical protein